jgi:hypothetical protein
VFENLAARSVWVCGYVSSCPVLNGASSSKPGGHDDCPTPKDPQVTGRGPPRMARWWDYVCFMFTEGGGDWGSPIWLAPESSFFGWVVPPLQPRVVGPYLVRGLWFPIHLLPVGTGPI